MPIHRGRSQNRVEDSRRIFRAGMGNIVETMRRIWRATASGAVELVFLYAPPKMADTAESVLLFTKDLLTNSYVRVVIETVAVVPKTLLSVNYSRLAAETVLLSAKDLLPLMYTRRVVDTVYLRVKRLLPLEYTRVAADTVYLRVKRLLSLMYERITTSTVFVATRDLICSGTVFTLPNLAVEVGESVTSTAAGITGLARKATITKESGPSWLTVEQGPGVPGVTFAIITASPPEGTPLEAYVYRVRATDGMCTTISSGVVTVTGTPCPEITVTAPSISVAQYQSESADATQDGLTDAVTWSLTSSSTWISIDSSSGRISVRPGSAPVGNYMYSVTAASGDCSETATGTVTVTAGDPPVGFSFRGEPSEMDEGDVEFFEILLRTPRSFTLNIPQPSITGDTGLGISFDRRSNPSEASHPYRRYRLEAPEGGTTRGTAVVSATGSAPGYSSVTKTFQISIDGGGTIAVPDVAFSLALSSVSVVAGSSVTVGISGITPSGTSMSVSSSDEAKAAASVAASGSTGTVTISGVAEGSATVRVTGRAAGYDSTAKDISVTVTRAPVVTPDPDVTAPDFSVLRGSSVTASVTTSNYSGTPTITKVSGPSWLTVSAAGVITAAPGSAVVLGKHSYQVRATAPGEDTTNDTGSVTVTAPNCPSVTVDTADQTVDGGASVALSATTSNADSFAWSGEGTFADGAAEDTSWTAPAATTTDQSYVLTLTGSKAGTCPDASDTVTITVRGVAPTVTVSLDSESQSVQANRRASVGGSVTPGDSSVSVATSDSSVATASISQDPMSSDFDVNIEGVAEGSATITVTGTKTVQGRTGMGTETIAVTVTAAPAGASPTISVDPSSVTVKDDGSILVFATAMDADVDDSPTISASSADDTIATASAGDTTDGTLPGTREAEITISGAAVGSTTVTVTATDGDGNTGTASVEVTVVAGPPPAQAPQISFTRGPSLIEGWCSAVAHYSGGVYDGLSESWSTAPGAIAPGNTTTLTVTVVGTGSNAEDDTADSRSATFMC